jgi:hypothetical protein
MKDTGKHKIESVSRQNPVGAEGIPLNVSKWFRISLILNSIMGVAFVAAIVRNYYSSNLLAGDYSLPLLFFLSPVLLRVTYFTTKNHLEANKDKLESFGSSRYICSYDDFLISVIKLFLFMAFIRLIIEFIGQSGWSSLSDHFPSSVRQFLDLTFGGMDGQHKN